MFDMTAPEYRGPYIAPCGCRVWPGDGVRPDTWEVNPQCAAHGARPPTPPAQSSGNGCAVSVLVLLAVVAGLYIAMHAYTYRGCIIDPGIFQWPKSCF